MNRMTMLVRSLVAPLLVTALLVPSRPAGAQGSFAGTWTIKTWQPAPWLEGAERRTIRPEGRVLGKQVTFERRRVRGPAVMACTGPKYEIRDVPFDGLFQGGLTRPAAQATALGFKGPRVTTLDPGCEFEYHLVATDTALFALDNVLYTMVRDRPPRR
jgi:hypothetical protein